MGSDVVSTGSDVGSKIFLKDNKPFMHGFAVLNEVDMSLCQRSTNLQVEVGKSLLLLEIFGV